MSFKKKMLTVAAVSALTAATAVPAMALENEFHGMYKFMGYQSNAFNGVGLVLDDQPRSGWHAEQRARILYTAKANDNLKLVTHFELDSRFGGVTGGYKGTTGNDSGNLDADQLTLETKNVYLDTNCPITGTNVKIGLQPWADAYSSLFLLADMTGVYATKKFDPFTVSLGWFRFDDNTTNVSVLSSPRQTADLIVADGKFAINKDMKVGASYYYIHNDTVAFTAGTPAVATGSAVVPYEDLHMVGVNADMNFGPASVKPFAAYQFGEITDTTDISAWLFGATAKVKAGPGAINVAAMYLSGDEQSGAVDTNSFQTLGGGFTYFNAANMWLLIRNSGAINSSFSVLGNDMTVGGRGSLGVFAGYEGTMDKIFYNANVGHMRTAKDRGSEDQTIGTEVNAQVGYKVYDNLSVSVAAAYALLGNGLDGATAASAGGDRIDGFGSNNADDPYLFNVQVSYVF